MKFHQGDTAELYLQSWRDLRRRSRVRWIVILSFLPGFLVMMLCVSLVLGDVPKAFSLWVGGGWIAALLAADLYRRHFRHRAVASCFFVS